MNGSRLFRSMIVLALALGVAACTGGPSPTAVSSIQAPEYRLGPGDKLRITVFGEATMNGEYVVTPNGDVAFPLIGDVVARGLSASQLQSALVAKLADGYMLDPRIGVEVLNYRPYYILGEVGRAGEYPYVSSLSVLQAIATAGGYTYRANQQRVFILRAGAAQEEVYDLKGKAPVWVMPGDTIRVGERYF